LFPDKVGGLMRLDNRLDQNVLHPRKLISPSAPFFVFTIE
jgi:hypothetical protein